MHLANFYTQNQDVDHNVPCITLANALYKRLYLLYRRRVQREIIDRACAAGLDHSLPNFHPPHTMTNVDGQCMHLGSVAV